MVMRNRKTILYGALGLMLLLYIGDVALRKLIDEPLSAAETRGDSLRKSIDDHRLAIARADRKLKSLPELERRSLPRDPVTSSV